MAIIVNHRYANICVILVTQKKINKLILVNDR